MDDKAVSSRSLQSELTRWIFIITVSICTLGGITTGLLAYFEAREIQDEVLLQIAQLISGTDNSNSSKLDYHHEDSTIIVQSLENDNGELGRISAHSDGFATIKSKGISWRVYIIRKHDDLRFAVAQQTELRNEIAWSNALSAILPISLLAVILLGLMRWLITSRLKPIIKLSQMADKQSSNDLIPLSTQSIPTEIKPFIEAINRLLLRTKHTLTQQRRFIANASHELRTPITALSLLAENLDKKLPPSEQRKQLGLMQHGLDRLNNLVNQLLNLARLQNTEYDSAQTIRLDEIVKDVVVLLYPLAEQKNIDLGITETGKISVQDFNGGLKQLVENALANAIYYTPVDGRIDISVCEKDGTAEFSISDSGPGIDEQEIEKVLTPFYRGKDNTEPGSGLGLAICSEIAKQHQGKISLSNRKSGGLTFTYVQAKSSFST